MGILTFALGFVLGLFMGLVTIITIDTMIVNDLQKWIKVYHKKVKR